MEAITRSHGPDDAVSARVVAVGQAPVASPIECASVQRGPGAASVSGPRHTAVVHRSWYGSRSRTSCGESVGYMTDELSDPELTEDEVVMLEVGWLDVWLADREAPTAARGAG